MFNKKPEAPDQFGMYEKIMKIAAKRTPSSLDKIPSSFDEMFDKPDHFLFPWEYSPYPVNCSTGVKCNDNCN
ncbi:MAG: hypothetical protein HRT36_07010 [Alphaproteobacteria bacterium]|nr:hypothetical protein [Alphaproteobacteria bacterium]